jgi:hypothetical protein
VNVEEQLRAAGRAVTDQVRDLPRLTLPPEAAPARRRRGRSPHRRSRWSAWLIPLAAGAAVAVIAATLVAVRDIPGTTHRPAAKPAASSSASATTSPATDPETLPSYFAAITGWSNGLASQPGTSGVWKPPPPDSLMIGETTTGAKVAALTPPRGTTFGGLAGSANDSTFVVDDIPRLTSPIIQGPHTWYLLRIDPGTGRPAKLSRLSIPVVPRAAEVEGISLSPDGGKFAVLYQPGRNLPATGPFTLKVYSVATGALLHAWIGHDPYHGSYGYGSETPPDNNTNLSWTADGQRLAFVYRSSNGPDASLRLRVLDLKRQGTDLFADSTVIVTIPAIGYYAWCETLGIRGDGRAAMCGAQLAKVLPKGIVLDALRRSADNGPCAGPTVPNEPGLAEFSVSTGKLTRVLYQMHAPATGGCFTGAGDILWSSPSGDRVLGSVWSFTRNASKEAIVIYDHGSITRRYWPAVSLSAWLVAF